MPGLCAKTAHELTGKDRDVAIDVHAHCFPDEYLDLITRFGSTSAGYARGLQAGDSAEELHERFRLMDAAGISKQILSVSPQLPYFEDEAQAIEAARLANDIYADLIRRFPDRFAAFAAVPLPHLEASLSETSRALDELGMVGVTANNSVLGRSLADESFEPFFAELDRRKTALFVHPAGKSAYSPLIAESGLTWQIGAPIEDTIIATQLIARNIPLRYPNLRIILSHLGGALPLLLKRLDHQLHGNRHADSASPSMQARRMWYDTVSHNDVVALTCAVEALGANQLLLGTDFPYLTGEWLIGAVTHIAEAGLDETITQRILHESARELLGAS